MTADRLLRQTSGTEWELPEDFFQQLLPRMGSLSVNTKMYDASCVESTTFAHPMQPRYTETWNAAEVVRSIPTWGNNAQQSLMNLTTKLVLLLALAKAPKVSELHSWNPPTVQWLPDLACIQGNDPAKTPSARRCTQSFLCADAA